MKISSSQVLFNSAHQKTSHHDYSQQRTASGQPVILQQNERVAGRRETVDLSYEARMQSTQSVNTTRLSAVTDGEQTTTYQQNKATSTVVSSIIKRDITIESAQTTSPLPIINLQPPVNPISVQRYGAILELGTPAPDTENQTIDVSALRNPVINAISADDQISLGEGNRITEARVDIRQQHFFQEAERLQMGAMGTITTDDGRKVDFALGLDMARNFELEESLTQQVAARTLIDPLVISLDGGAAGLTSSSFSFDLDADGSEEEISFVSQGSGFLALDMNRDGQINDGSELFGTQGTEGFADLARYDGDGNKWIDENDEIFADLKVWTRNEQGEDQLLSLKDAGVGAIYLGSTASSFDLTDSENNLLGQVKRSGVFLTEQGQVASIQELDLAIHNQALADTPTDAPEPDLAASYQQLLDQLSPAPAPATRDEPTEPPPPTMLELLLQPAEEGSRPAILPVVQQDGATERKTEQTSRIAQTTVLSVSEETIAVKKEDTEEAAEKPVFMPLDASRLEILARLNSHSEQVRTKQDSDNALMSSIIENLEGLRNAPLKQP